VAYAVEQPAHGQARVSNELRKRGVLVCRLSAAKMAAVQQTDQKEWRMTRGSCY
jgi:hypothetical protein